MSHVALVVDDDASMRLLLSGILADAGYRVVCAAGGAEAIRELEGPAPDLVILDLLMPSPSGWDILEFMEERPRLCTIPVVVLTAVADDEETPSGRPVIHKPIDADLLVQLVRELLNQSPKAAFGKQEPPSDLLPRSRHRTGLLPSD